LVITPLALAAAFELMVPAGNIEMTARATAPSGWLIADGSQISRTQFAKLFQAIGTSYGVGNGSTTFNIPDMRGRVPVGRDAGQSEFDVLGETGGAKTHTITVAEMPSHTHVQDAHNHTQNAHSHGISDPGHNHSQNAHNHTQNAHGHGNTLQVVANVGAVGSNQTNLDDFPGSAGPISAFNQVVGNMTGGILNTTATNIATTATNNGSFTGVTVNSSTATNQATTATNQTTGSGEAHNNLQPYLTLNFIIKT
jgi:microcystin-dependent protein